MGGEYAKVSPAPSTRTTSASTSASASTSTAANPNPHRPTALGIPRRYSIPLVVATGYANDGVEPVSTKRFDQADVFFDGQFGVPFAPTT